MLARTAMSSFSDAHELVEIPIIAANLHRLMLPQQSQIWAVLHAGDSDRRLACSLAATFLGRMCLSGEIAQLSDPQWAIVQRAIDLYPKAAPVIRDGVSRRFGSVGERWRHPHGWQGVRRISADRRSALVTYPSLPLPRYQRIRPATISPGRRGVSYFRHARRAQQKTAAARYDRRITQPDRA